MMSMKKITALLLAVVMVVGLLPLSVFAAEENAVLTVGGSQAFTLAGGESVSFSFSPETDGGTYVAYTTNQVGIDVIREDGEYDANAGASIDGVYAYAEITNAVAGGDYTFTVTNNSEEVVTDTVYLAEPQQPLADEVVLSLMFSDETELTGMIAGTGCHVYLLPTPFYNLPDSVSYTSSDPNVFTVEGSSNSEVYLNLVGVGEAVLTATWGDSQSVSLPINVVSAPYDIAPGTEQTYSLYQGWTGFTFENTTEEECKYILYIPKDASVYFSGWNTNFEESVNGTYSVCEATLMAGETGLIKIWSETAQEAVVGMVQATGTVASNVTLNHTELALTVGETADLFLQLSDLSKFDYIQDFTCSESNTLCFDYGDRTKVVVRAVEEGTDTVTITTANGFTKTCQITVTKPEVTLTEGETTVNHYGAVNAKFTPVEDGLYFLYCKEYNVTINVSANAADDAVLDGAHYSYFHEATGTYRSGVTFQLTAGEEYTFYMETYSDQAVLGIEKLQQADTFTLDRNDMTVWLGEESGHMVSILTEEGLSFVEITSSDESVAKVMGVSMTDFVVEGVGAGTAVFTVTDGTTTQTLTVTVREPSDTLELDEVLVISGMEPGELRGYLLNVPEGRDGEYAIVAGTGGLDILGYETYWSNSYVVAQTGFSGNQKYVIVLENTTEETLRDFTFHVSAKQELAGISLRDTELTLKVGETATVYVDYDHIEGAEELDYTLDVGNVISVSKNSTSFDIQANEAGTAILTVTSASGKTATCKVTVERETVTLTSGTTQSITQCEGGYDLLFTPETDGLYYVYTDNYQFGLSVRGDANGNAPVSVWHDKGGGMAGILLRLTGGKQYTFSLNGPVGLAVNVTVEQSTQANSFSVSAAELSGFPGGEGRIFVYFAPEGALDVVTVTSDNEAVAEVDQQYSTLVWVYFRAAGTANITFTNGTQTETVKVTVKQPDYTIEKNQKITVTLQPNQELAFDAVVTEAKEYALVVNNPKIAAASGYAQSGADANYSVTKVYMSPDYSTNVFTVGNWVSDEAVTVEVYFTDAVTPTSFSLSKAELSVKVGEEVNLSGIFDSVAGIERVSWETSNNSVVTVRNSYSDALLTGMSTGTAVITGTTASGLTATCTVTVTEPEVTLELDKEQTVQIPGEIMNIRFTPAETGIYWLSQPYETVVYGGVQVTDANGTEFTNFWHEDADMTNGGQAAKLEAGKTYNFRFTSYDGSGTAPEFTMRKLPSPASLTLLQTEITAHVGEDVEIRYEIQPDGAPGHVTATVADESIANVYVYESGEIELWLKKPGTTTVTLTDAAGNTAELKVTCEEPVADLTAAGQTASVTLKKNETASFRFTFPENGEFYFYTDTDSDDIWVGGHMACSYNYDYMNAYIGYVCGGSAGEEFYLIITNKGEEQTVNVAVDKLVAPESIELGLTYDNLNDCTRYVGELVDVFAYFTPALASPENVTFSSSDPTVADIRGGMSINTREILCLKPGTTTITAVAGDLKAEVTLTVIEPEMDIEYGEVVEYTLEPGERIAYSLHVGENVDEGIFVSTEPVFVKLTNGVLTFIDSWFEAIYEEDTDLVPGISHLLVLENVLDETISGKFYLGEEVPATKIALPEKLTGVVGETLELVLFGDPFYTVTDEISVRISDDTVLDFYAFDGRVMNLILNQAGTADVIVSLDGKEYVCEVTVLCDCFNHVSQVNAKAANCTESGILAHWVCDTCGKTYEDKEATKELTSVVVPAADHKEETVAGKAATCTEAGLTEGKKCSVCGTVTVAQTAIEKLAHKEETVAGKAATCTEEGLTEGKKCSVCGTVTVEQKAVAAAGHKLVKTEAKAATYTAEGNIEYWTCSVCGKLFADEKGETEIVDPAAVITAKLVQVDEKEESKVSVSEDAVDQAIEEALKGNTGSEDTGSGDSGSADSGSTGETTPAPKKEVVIQLNQVETKVESAVLPVTSVNKVADADANLTIQLTEVKVTMDTQTLKTVSEAIKSAGAEIPADSKVSLKVQTVQKEAVEQILTQSQKTALVNTNVVAAVSASLIVESAQETKSIHDFGGGKITIRLPFTPEEGKAGEDYTILYVAEDGETEQIDTHYENGHLVFAVSHFSEYVVVETATIVPPADPDSPPTGDNAVILPVLVLMAVAMLGVTALILNKKRFAR